MTSSTGLPDVSSEPVEDSLRRLISEAVAPGGGWAYLPGRRSRLEPTCWGWLALNASGAPPDDRQARLLALMARWQRPDGLLVEDPSLPPNLAFNGLAALVLGAHGEGREMHRRLIAALVQSRGVRLPAMHYSRQNGSLRGWPWIDRTFSWVEPTAWCLCALKRAQRETAGGAVQVRIDEAERLLIDRACRAGGWNYGNADIFGKELRPYIPTTAAALLALQDRADHPTVARALGYLAAHCLDEPAGHALALSLLCLRVYDRPADHVKARLIEQAARTGFLSNAHVTAMALYSLTASRHAARAFRLS